MLEEKNQSLDQSFEQTIMEVASRIQSQNSSLKRAASVLKTHGSEIKMDEIDGVIDPCITKAVVRDGLTDTEVAGVDGGVLGQQLQGLDLILMRAVGVIFRYENGALGDVKYFPGEAPTPKLSWFTQPLDAHEFELMIGIKRQLMEIKLATQLLKTNSIDSLLLDGSIAPQYVERQSDPALCKLYHELIGAFSELYSSCVKTDTLLAGAVKDSRSSRLLDILREHVVPKLDQTNPSAEVLSSLENSRDTVFLNHMLEVGNRTFAFRYSGEPFPPPIRDLGEWGSRIFGFYIKTVPYDRPLRVEFLATKDVGETADKVASMMYSISSHHDAFGLPSILIEADARARLHEGELGTLCDCITARLGPSPELYLRRDTKPF